MKLRKDLLKQVMHGTELDTVPLPRIPLVEVVGHNRVLIENHYGVTAYATNEIQVQVKHGHIAVFGRQLMLAQMSKEQIIITGCIDGIRLLER